MPRRSSSSIILTIVVVIVLFGVYKLYGSSSSGSNSGSNSGNNKPASASPTASRGEPKWGVQTKTTSCQAHSGLPDSACTPGAIFPDATKEKICVPGYAKSVRDVPQSVKNKAYAAYGIKSRVPGQYEVDHLVSLQLGGSNDISNLWPEAASPKPGFHEKDAVENYLHSQICSGAISVKEAQIEIATNWLTAYNRLKNKTPDNTPDGEP